MNLTLNALNKVKDTCEQCSALESLFVAEGQSELLDSIQDLHVNVDATLRLLEELSDATEYLKVNGYSDDWFNSINKDGALEGLVTFNMPKFFDNQGKRTEACLEGFIDTIKEWCLKAIKFILGLLNKIMDWRFKVAKMFDTKTWRMKGEELERKIGMICGKSDIAALWFQQHSIKADGFYDSAAMQTYVNAAISLLEAIRPSLKTPFDTNIIGTVIGGIDINGANTLDIRKFFINNLQKTLNDKGVKYNDVKTDGFTLKFDPTGKQYVEFIGIKSGTDLPKKDIEFFSAEELQKAAGEEMAALNVFIDKLSAVNSELYADLRSAERSYTRKYDDIRKMSNGTIDDEELKIAQIQVALTQVAIALVTQVSKFTDKCNVVCAYNHKILQAIADDIAKSKPNP